MNHNQILNVLQEFCKEDINVQALLVIGSYARKELEPYSDLDLIVISKKAPSLIFKSIHQELGENEKYSIQESGNKLIFFIGNELIKTEITVFKNTNDIQSLYYKSLKNSLENSILLDKTNSIASELSFFLDTQPQDDIVQLINSEVDKFLISFESASSMARREDVFQSYFQYNLSLTRYFRLLQLEMNDTSFLYAPKRIMNRLSLNQLRRVERINGSLRLYEIRDKIDRLAIEFREVYGRLYFENKGLTKTPEYIRNIISDILDRDLIWNFRDVSWINHNSIQPNRLFRSSSLSRFSSLKAFDKIIGGNQIERIIDLRQPWEIERYPYDAVSIDIQHLPFNLTQVNNSEGELYSNLFKNSHQIKLIFELLAEEVTTVISCQMGRDRTGFVISLILLSVGVPIDLVETDFLASQMGITKEEFRKIIHFIESKGGINALLEEYEVTPEILRKVRDWLIM